MKETNLLSYSDHLSTSSVREDFSEYVAHLQLHMALHARKLIPTLTHAKDSREDMLHKSQADFEKFISRQAL
jgi:hypothetical protein